jgi:hypothetical protein
MGFGSIVAWGKTTEKPIQMANVYKCGDDNTGQGKSVVTSVSNQIPRLLTRALFGLCQLYCDALHRKFGRTVAGVTMALLATALVLAVVVFSIIDAIVPFTRQSMREISKSSSLYFKLLVIAGAGLAVWIE